MRVVSTKGFDAIQIMHSAIDLISNGVSCDALKVKDHNNLCNLAFLFRLINRRDEMKRTALLKSGDFLISFDCNHQDRTPSLWSTRWTYDLV
jgi:hypothetical protein